jgi:hypothetical protein
VQLVFSMFCVCFVSYGFVYIGGAGLGIDLQKEEMCISER